MCPDEAQVVPDCGRNKDRRNSHLENALSRLLQVFSARVPSTRKKVGRGKRRQRVCLCTPPSRAQEPSPLGTLASGRTSSPYARNICSRNGCRLASNQPSILWGMEYQKMDAP